MPLTEEQRLRMEENKRKALEKRNLTDEQRRRMEENKRKALEKRKQLQNQTNTLNTQKPEIKSFYGNGGSEKQNPSTKSDIKSFYGSDKPKNNQHIPSQRSRCLFHIQTNFFFKKKVLKSKLVQRLNNDFKTKYLEKRITCQKVNRI